MVETKQTLAWEAVEHAYYEKTSDWFWIVGVVGGTITILGLIFSNVIIALLAAIATATIIIHAREFPAIVKVELLGNGVRVGNRIYPYPAIANFSLNEEHDPPVLILDVKAFLEPSLRIFIEDHSVEEVRDFLLDHLDEKYFQHSLLDSLIHYLGF